MTIALKAGVAAAETPRNRTVLFSVAMRRAPIDGAEDRELAAREGGAADHDRENRVELHLVPGSGDVDRHHLRDREETPMAASTAERT